MTDIKQDSYEINITFKFKKTNQIAEKTFYSVTEAEDFLTKCLTEVYNFDKKKE